MTHYQVLQISESASPGVISASYKALMRVYHPDNGTRPNAEMSRVVILAYKTLIDPEKRKEYDASTPRPIPIDPFTRRQSRAYPSPYQQETDAIQLNVQSMLERTLSAATEAALEHVIESNPMLGDLMSRIIDRKRRAG
jgi:curved DNA-binding protein CbpA